MIKESKAGNKLYQIKHKVIRKDRDEIEQSYYIRIGSATLKKDGVMIGSFDAVPINWDGSFIIVPVEDKNDVPY
jgi:hypothetical protein